MRLTMYQKREFIRKVTSARPTSTAEKEKIELLEKILFNRLPVEVQALVISPVLSKYVGTVLYKVYSPTGTVLESGFNWYGKDEDRLSRTYYWHRGESEVTLTDEEYKEYKDLYDVISNESRVSRDFTRRLEEVVHSCTTLNKLKTEFPEFVQHMPT